MNPMRPSRDLGKTTRPGVRNQHDAGQSALQRAADKSIAATSLGQVATQANASPVVQRSFELNGEEYYKGDVKEGTAAYKGLAKYEGYVAAAAALAAKDDVSPEFKTVQLLKAYLEKHHQDDIQSGASAGQKEEQELQSAVGLIGAKSMKPKGWGHAFSNGKHGEDMAAANGRDAVRRAKEEGHDKIGVWVSNAKAMALIEAQYAKMDGKDGVEFVDLGGMPESIGVQYTKGGKKEPCEGFFLKIQDGIVITAYPADRDQVKL